MGSLRDELERVFGKRVSEEHLRKRATRTSTKKKKTRALSKDATGRAATRVRSTEPAPKTSRRPIRPRQQQAAAEPCEASAPRYKLQVASDAKFAVEYRAEPLTLLESSIEEAGIQTEMLDASPSAPRELVLGLDFGSSCTKVVINDRAAGKSFAVVFGVDRGIRAYLLPTTVYEAAEGYSLNEEGERHGNLKSKLLDALDERAQQERAVAYLALTIRRARGWLFKRQVAIYWNVPIFWKLVLGIPKRQGDQDNEAFDVYKDIAAAAWIVAGSPGRITHEKVRGALKQVQGLSGRDCGVPVLVIPEIAAEIYGFVSSESFDTKGDNIFLMADVGGRTVDASLFHVRKQRATRWRFDFYTSAVRPLGVRELDKRRTAWWIEALSGESGTEQLRGDLERYQIVDAFDAHVPDRMEQYVSGVTINKIDGWGSPDDQFSRELWKHVRGDVFQYSVDRQVPKRQMIGVPFFLCGGGAHMSFYSVIQTALEAHVNTSVYATRRALHPPQDLSCEGIVNDEYHRLAVAYGLCRLETEDIVDAEPLPPMESNVDRYEDHYVSKDMC